MLWIRNYWYPKKSYAKKENIIASPTLVKELPLPVRILVGDMSNKEQVLVGLEIVSKNRELEK